MPNCRPDCKICGGSGFIRYEVPRSDSRFGKLFPCPNIPPDSPIFDNHGLTQQERTWGWENIRNRENVQEAVTSLISYVNHGKGMVYLYGGPGLAKTLMLKVVCAEWARTGRGPFHFTTLPVILEDLRSAYDDDDPGRALAGKEEKYCGFPLLAIDEVGVERQTDFVLEKFFTLINTRHEQGTERGESVLTVLASNLSPTNLDFRIADRLDDGRNRVIQLRGESYRPLLEWEKK